MAKSSVMLTSYNLAMILVTPICQIKMVISQSFLNQFESVIPFWNENDPYFSIIQSFFSFENFHIIQKVCKHIKISFETENMDHSHSKMV